MEGGGGKENSKKSLERKKEITQEELEKKLENLTKLLDKERNEKFVQQEKEQVEQEKKKLKLERKRKAEERWKTIRWVTKYLEENMEDFLAAIDDEGMISSEKEDLHSPKLLPPPTKTKLTWTTLMKSWCKEISNQLKPYHPLMMRISIQEH